MVGGRVVRAEWGRRQGHVVTRTRGTHAEELLRQLDEAVLQHLDLPVHARHHLHMTDATVYASALPCWPPQRTRQVVGSTARGTRWLHYPGARPESASRPEPCRTVLDLVYRPRACATGRQTTKTAGKADSQLSGSMHGGRAPLPGWSPGSPAPARGEAGRREARRGGVRPRRSTRCGPVWAVL